MTKRWWSRGASPAVTQILTSWPRSWPRDLVTDRGDWCELCRSVWWAVGPAERCPPVNRTSDHCHWTIYHRPRASFWHTTPPVPVLQSQCRRPWPWSLALRCPRRQILSHRTWPWEPSLWPWPWPWTWSPWPWAWKPSPLHVLGLEAQVLAHGIGLKGQVLGLGLQGQVLDLGLEGQVLVNKVCQMLKHIHSHLLRTCMAPQYACCPGALVAQWLARWLVIERSRVQLPASPLPSNNSGQVVHAHVPLSPSSIMCYTIARPTHRPRTRAGFSLKAQPTISSVLIVGIGL